MEELELFQKQARLLLSEADNKQSKIVKFYERKEGDFMEQIQKEKGRWYEKRVAMQHKIDRLEVLWPRQSTHTFLLSLAVSVLNFIALG